MARVDVRRDDFEDGVLPRICVGTGAPADRPYRLTVSWRPAWTWLLIFAGPVGWVAMVVATQVFERTASGYVPYTDAFHSMLVQRRQAALRVAASGIATALFGVVVLVALGEVAGLGLVLLVGGVLVAAVGGAVAASVPGSLTGTPDATGRWVTLTAVHPAFAAAYEAQEARRRAGRAAEVLDVRPIS